MHPRNNLVVLFPQILFFLLTTFKDVKNVDHLAFFGYQIRAAREVIENYTIVKTRIESVGKTRIETRVERNVKITKIFYSLSTA
jgi:hypothetical protein